MIDERKPRQINRINQNDAETKEMFGEVGMNI
jgi:hypothetical protein